MDLEINNGKGNVLDIQRYEDGCLGIEIDGHEMYLTKENEVELAMYFKNNVSLDGVSKYYTEKDMDNAYDQGFKDGNKRDLRGSLFGFFTVDDN